MFESFNVEQSCYMNMLALIFVIMLHCDYQLCLITVMTTRQAFDEMSL